MIFTRSWLEEFVDLSKISDADILLTLNKIGLEVASYKKIEIPKGVVVGKVIECIKHPNADKLSLCKVDNGKTLLDVVCGAKNVKEGIFVALATIGAKLPNGLVIKQAELRGVQSYGMLCSSTELGLSKINDGIMILDGSVSSLRIGEELSSIAQIADSVFEIEVTPNRGDCLSVRGVARELAAYYGLELKEIDTKGVIESEKGIGRIVLLHSSTKTSANVAIRVFEHTAKHPHETFLIDYRLSLVGETIDDDRLKNISKYVSTAVGVNFSFFKESSFAKNDEKIDIYIDVDESGAEEIRGKKQVLKIGIKQCKDSFPSEDDANIIMAATYISPEKIQNLPPCERDDALFFRSSRGSEPDLAVGLGYAAQIMSSLCKISFYSGAIEDSRPVEREPIKVDIAKINTIIGGALDKNLIVNLLRKLYFSVTVNAEFDSCSVEVPPFRHDISNVYDLSEEIVRIRGIDNIESSPMTICESSKNNDSLLRYRYVREIRQKAADAGFFECVHFIFADKSLQERFGFGAIDEEKELLNPITSELNTLRTSLLPTLLTSASKNIKNSYGKVALFESGTVFAEDRAERSVISFVFCGDSESESIKNSGKPKPIDFALFVSKLATVFGGFSLEPKESDGEFLHPYQAAKIIKEGKEIGFAAKLHPKAEEFFGLKNCFVAEIELSNLQKESKRAKEFSRYQKSVRDLSLVLKQRFEYKEIRAVIEERRGELIKEFYPIDIYAPDGQKEVSLTIRFVLQADDRTLEEKEIAGSLDSVLAGLREKLNIGLKQ